MVGKKSKMASKVYNHFLWPAITKMDQEFEKVVKEALKQDTDQKKYYESSQNGKRPQKALWELSTLEYLLIAYLLVQIFSHMIQNLTNEPSLHFWFQASTDILKVTIKTFPKCIFKPFFSKFSNLSPFPVRFRTQKTSAIFHASREHTSKQKSRKIL